MPNEFRLRLSYMNPNTKPWAKRIFERAEKMKLDDAELARACRIKGGSVGNWKDGRTKMIRGDNLVAVAGLLQVSCVWIITGRIGGPNDPPPPISELIEVPYDPKSPGAWSLITAQNEVKAALDEGLLKNFDKAGILKLVLLLYSKLEAARLEVKEILRGQDKEPNK